MAGRNLQKAKKKGEHTSGTAFVEGLGRDDLFLRGSRVWQCGKCGFPRNYTNRCWCQQCGERPQQWILDAQAKKVKELDRQAAQRSGTPSPTPSRVERPTLRPRGSRWGAKTSESREREGHGSGDAAGDQQFKDEIAELEDLRADLQRRGRRQQSNFLADQLKATEERLASLREEQRRQWGLPRLLKRAEQRWSERKGRLTSARQRVADAEKKLEEAKKDFEGAEASMATRTSECNEAFAELEAIRDQIKEAENEETPNVSHDEETRRLRDVRLAKEAVQRLADSCGGPWALLLKAIPSTCSRTKAASTTGTVEKHEGEPRMKMARQQPPPDLHEQEKAEGPMELEPNQTNVTAAAGSEQGIGAQQAEVPSSAAATR